MGMGAELIPEPMKIGRSCMKVVGKFSDQNLSMPFGKRSTMNGPRDLQRNFPIGLERDQARKPEHPKLLKARKRVVKRHLPNKRTMRKKRKGRRRKRRKSKSNSQNTQQPLISKHSNLDFLSSFINRLAVKVQRAVEGNFHT